MFIYRLSVHNQVSLWFLTGDKFWQVTKDIFRSTYIIRKQNCNWIDELLYIYYRSQAKSSINLTYSLNLRLVYPMLPVSLDCPFWLLLMYFLTFIYRYIDDLLSINNPNFANWIPLTCPQRTWDKGNNRNNIFCFESWHLLYIWQQWSNFYHTISQKREGPGWLNVLGSWIT